MPVNLNKNLGLNLDSKPQGSHNALFEAVLLVVICGLFAWFIILPKNSEVGQKQASYDALSKQEQGIAAKAADLNDQLSALHLSNDKISELDEALPLDGDVIKPRLLLQKLADDSGVTVGNMSITSKPGEIAAGNVDLIKDPFAPTVTRSAQTMSAAVFVLGDFGQLQTFLQALENNGRLMNVNDFLISQDSQGKLNMRVTLDMYYLAP
jgi:Tfp pilus assembly protein PilO